MSEVRSWKNAVLWKSLELALTDILRLKSLADLAVYADFLFSYAFLLTPVCRQAGICTEFSESRSDEILVEQLLI